jgi:hypothetical protein
VFAAGWTALPTLSISTDRLTSAYRAVSATGTYNASGTISGTWMAAIVTYVAAAVAPDNAPVVVAPVTASVSENGQVTVNVTASDPDGQAITALTASFANLPAGTNAVFTPNASKTAGTLTWTPTFADGRVAAYNVTFTATNALSGSATTAITVNNVDRAPVVTAPATMSAPKLSVMTETITVADLDGDAITSLAANLSALPAGNNAVFTPNATKTAGTLTWTPQAADASGPYTVTFTASNALSGNASTAITLTAIDNAPVVVAPATASVNENGQVTVNVTASDPDGEAITALTADLANLPVGHNAVFTPNPSKTAGTLTWTPTFADGRAAAYNVTFSATNALSGAATTAITVNNIDRAPVVTAPATAATPRSAVMTVNITAVDPDGDAITSLTASLVALPVGNNAVFTANASKTGGTLTWTPQAADGVGPYNVTFTALNALSGNASMVITLTAGDQPPAVFAPATATGSETGVLTVNVQASDPDGQAITSLTANLANLPAGNNAVFTANAANTAGTLTWTPTFADGRAAAYNVTFTAANALSGSSTTAITVNNVDRAPVVTAPATATVTAGSVVTVNITAADPDGDAITALTASLTNLPAGNNAVFTANAAKTGGTLTWTPTFADGRAAAYNVTFTAANALSSPVATTAITVNSTSASNLVTNPGFETATTGWSGYSSATLTRVAGGHSGGFCAELAGPATTAAFGINDSPNVVTSTPAAGTSYTITAWVRSAAHQGKAQIKIREYAPSGAQVGSMMLSPVVTLSTTWQQLTLNIVSAGAGSTLDMQIVDTPVVAGEVFQLDDISYLRTSPAAQPLVQSPASFEQGMVFAAHMTPNPVRAQGELLFTTTKPGAITVQVFDVTGRLVSQPLDGAFVPVGHHGVSVATRTGTARLSAGTYFYRLRAAEGIKAGRFVVME